MKNRRTPEARSPDDARASTLGWIGGLLLAATPFVLLALFYLADRMIR